VPSSKGKPRPDRKRGRPFDPTRRRYCHFCKDKVVEVDYKDLVTLRRCISERGKIKAPRVTGTCRRHQRQVAVAVKRAREMALLPYATVGRDLAGGGGRGPRR
jgi:small subunit ribosomal protein S18